jgi:hypothetical protein
VRVASRDTESGRCQAISAYAGFEAERVIDPEANEEQSTNDFDGAAELLRWYQVIPRGCSFVGDDVWWGQIERLRKRARAMVRANAEAIRVLAEALLEHETLSGDDAYKRVDGLLKYPRA